MAKHKLLHRVQIGSRFADRGEIVDLSPEDAAIAKAHGAATPCDEEVADETAAPEAPASPPPTDSNQAATAAPQAAAAAPTSRAEKKNR